MEEVTLVVRRLQRDCFAPRVLRVLALRAKPLDRSSFVVVRLDFAIHRSPEMARGSARPARPGEQAPDHWAASPPKYVISPAAVVRDVSVSCRSQDALSQDRRCREVESRSWRPVCSAR
jgi:hypothetical protein